MTIKINELNNRVTQRAEIQVNLLNLMRDELFRLSDLRKLCFHAIKKFDLGREIDITITTDIENACKSILIKMDLVVDKKDIFTNFFNDVMGLEKFPVLEKQRIEKIVKEHLLQIDKLIERYKREDVVRGYISENKSPHSHEEGVLVDFYRRCVAERDDILSYYLYDLEERALLNCRARALSINLPLGKWHWDTPYTFAIPGAIRRFDSDQISQSRHRLEDVLVGEIRTFEELYQSGEISEFYERLTILIPIDAAFNRITSVVAAHPILSSRIEIIDELEALWSSKNFYGFYALILPQVEGIFTEICEIYGLKEATRSLPDKVFALRPHFEYSDFNFDYFQYDLPRRRNKFSHLGRDNEIESKCYDLIYDLYYVINVFNSLEHPVIALTNLIRRKQSRDASTVEVLSSLLKLIDLAKKEAAYRDIEKDVGEYINKFIPNNVPIYPILFAADYDISRLIRKFATDFQFISALHSDAIDLNNLTSHEIDENGGKIKEAMKIYKSGHSGDLKKIGTIEHVADQIGNYPNWPSKVETDLGNKIIRDNSIMLKRIHQVENL